MLLDSLTRLCRAHSNAAGGGGRTLSGGVDAAAVHPPKRLTCRQDDLRASAP